MLEKIKKFKHKEIIAFVIVMFVFYLLTLSRSWDDEDSILFIRGVREFNVAEYQPHPPGYPIYIFFGKISVFLMKDELLGLTILSAIFGALSLAVFYFLIFEMYNKKTALMSTMLMAVTPLFWLNSLKAMSDIPGLFFILLSMYFIYHFIKYKEIKSLYIGSFVSAIAIGVRFHATFVVIPLLVYTFFKVKNEKKKNFKKVGNKKERIRINKNKIFYSIVIFLIGILIWLVPVLIINGFFGYFDVVLGQFLYRFKKPEMSTLAGDFNFNYLFPRVKYFLGFFLAEGYGINLWDLSILPVIAFLAYLVFLFLSYEKLKDKRILFFVVGLFFYSIMVFLFLPPHNPRYFLPLIPFISLLFAFGVSWFGKYNYLAFAFLFILLLIHSAPLAKEIHTVEAAPIQLVNYIKANYNLDDVIILKDSMTTIYLSYYDLRSYPHASLELGILDSTTLVEEGELDGELNKSVSRKDIRNKILKYSISNKSVLRESVFDKNKTILIINPSYNTTQSYNLTLIKMFQRDFRVHPKHNTLYLYEIKKEL